MEKKKTKMKWREIRSAVTMLCVMAAMLSTATFAWFTLTSNPVVNGLQMTAATSGGLKISKNHQNWFNAIDMSEKNDVDNVEAIESVTLLPATLMDKTSTQTLTLDSVSKQVPLFKSPVYNGFTVDGTDDIDTEDEMGKYVASCRYFIQNEKSTTANVGIITAPTDTLASKIAALDGGIGVTADGTPNIEGSFVALISDPDDDSDQDHTAVEAVRIVLVVTGQETGGTTDTTKIIVYEPNGPKADGTDAVIAGSTYAINGLGGAVTPDVVSTYDTGVITTGKGTTDNTSVGLFEIPAGEYVTVDMYVWFEGQDKQCVDQIMQDQIEVQLQFTDVTATSTN